MKMLRVIEIHKDARRLLLVVVSVEHQASRMDGLCMLHGKIEPVAVVISNTSSTRIWNLPGENFSLETLSERVPELNEMLLSSNRQEAR